MFLMRSNDVNYLFGVDFISYFAGKKENVMLHCDDFQ